MRKSIELLIVLLVVTACGAETEKYPIKPTNWESRKSDIASFANYKQGKTYLPVYSHIYHIHGDRTFDLTTTVSIRNISATDSVYILKADYFNTAGENIRQYVNSPVYIKPLETLEIIIDENDIEGGSGANFVFDWATVPTSKNPPLFEAVMISTNGQQGLSFTTRGVPISE